MAVDKTASSFPSVGLVFVVLMHHSIFTTAFTSRGLMSSGVPYYAMPHHRVVLVGDFLSWDSADYKIAQALEIVGTVEDVLVLQLDEVGADLLALQLRSFDPTIVLISVRTRAYEHLVQLVQHVAWTESRRGEDVVVAVLHLQAHAIPAAQRAFARSVVLHAGGEQSDDKYEDRTARYRADYNYGRDFAALPLLLYIDEWAPELEGAEGLLPVWLGPMVPESWCWDQKDDCDHTMCPRDNLQHDIIVLVGHDNCAFVGGDAVEMRTGLAGSEACRVAAYVRERHGAERVLMLQAGNASAAREQNAHTENQREQNVDMTRNLLRAAKVLVITLDGSNSAASFSPVQHAIEAMALGGPALVMDEPLAQSSESMDDIINGTHALVYRAGDLLALGVALDHLLADSYHGDNNSSMSRCVLRQRACKDVCIRHSAVRKLVHVLDELHDRGEEESPPEPPAADVRSLSPLQGQDISAVGTAGKHTRLLGGVDMDLGSLLPRANISFHVKVAHLSSFTQAERSVAASVILREDAPRFHEAVGYNTSAEFVAEHEGFFMAALRGVTVVHDAVICNTTHAITAMATKHSWHPPVEQIQGCQLHDDDPAIRHVGTALLLVRFMGWFWGHFCLDSLVEEIMKKYKLAIATEIFQEKGQLEEFNVILEARTHASALAMVQAVLGRRSNSRVLFMSTECLRGNSRVCPYYFRSQQLLIVEMFPNLVNLGDTKDDIQDTVPQGIRLVQRRIGAFFDAHLDEIERARQGRAATSGSNAVRYGEAGECSQGKAHRLTVLKASGEADRGRSSRACRGMDAWFTSHLETPESPPARPLLESFRVVYIGRGSSPCPWGGRTRCVLNAAELVDILDSVGLFLSHFHSIESGTHTLAESATKGMHSGCVHINHEHRTHTFLEVVDIIRHSNLIVGVQGSQLFDALFATRGTSLVEMVPTLPENVSSVRQDGTWSSSYTESNRIFYGSLGMRTAILPIYGVQKFEPYPFPVDPCRLVRLLGELFTELKRCNQLLQIQLADSVSVPLTGLNYWCRDIQECFVHLDHSGF